MAGGTSTGSFSGPTGGTAYVDGKTGSVSGYARLSGHSVTDLAKQLTSPPEPQKPDEPRGFGLWWLILWVPAFYAIAIPADLLMFPGGFLATWGASNDSIIGKIAMIIGIPLGILGFVVGLKYGWKFVKYVNNQKVKGDIPRYKAEMAQWKIDQAQWDSAVQVWNRLYYCHRNGTIFDPETGKTCDPANIKDFIYEQS